MLSTALPALAVWGMWRGTRGEWARFTPRQRRQGIIFTVIGMSLGFALAFALFTFGR